MAGTSGRRRADPEGVWACAGAALTADGTTAEVKRKCKRKVRGPEKPIAPEIRKLAELIREGQEQERIHDLLHRKGWSPSRQPYDVFVSMWPEVVRNSIGPELAKHAIAGTLPEVCRALEKNKGASRKSDQRRLVINTIRKLRDEGEGKPPSYKDVVFTVIKEHPSVLKRFSGKGEEWPDSLERWIRKVAEEEKLLLAKLK